MSIDVGSYMVPLCILYSSALIRSSGEVFSELRHFSPTFRVRALAVGTKDVFKGLWRRIFHQFF